MAKNQYARFVTPKGEVVGYCALDKPSKDYGNYSVNVAVKASDAKDLLALIDASMEEAKNVAREAGATAKWKYIAPFEKEEVDGKETGRLIFKLRAKGERKGKDGTVSAVEIDAFDSKGTQIKMPRVGAGSVVRVAGAIGPWAVKGRSKGEGEYGLKLYLNGVKILELVKVGSRDAAGYGFGDVEDGFVAANETSADTGTTDNDASEVNDEDVPF